MKQVIFGMAGHPAAGKSTFAKKLVKEFNASHINKDDFRDFFAENILDYKGADKSYSNEKILSVNRVVRVASDKLIEELYSRGVSFIVDGYGKFKESRERMRQFFKEKKINLPIIIIHVVEDKDVILERLKERDSGGNTKWVENFKIKWEPGFSKPSEEECDFFVEVNKYNHEDAIEKIRNFVNS
ncbi:ATP-binding protein [Candidatus Woesearchaeota archaeon]|nr:ATP-binding protein [Candidatus Woesearchaeota archaeon]